MSLSPSPAALASTGLPETAITAIQKVLAAHPEVEQAILYGSRALGRQRPASDIDLTLIGSGISATALLAHTERIGQVLYQRQEQAPAQPAPPALHR